MTDGDVRNKAATVALGWGIAGVPCQPAGQARVRRYTTRSSSSQLYSSWAPSAWVSRTQAALTCARTVDSSPPSLPTSPGPLRLSMESWHAAQPLGVWNHRPRSRVRGCEPTLVGSPSTLFRCFLILVSILYVWQTGSLSFVSQVTAPARRAVKHAFAFRRWGCACSIGRPR